MSVTCQRCHGVERDDCGFPVRPACVCPVETSLTAADRVVTDRDALRSQLATATAETERLRERCAEAEADRDDREERLHATASRVRVLLAENGMLNEQLATATARAENIESRIIDVVNEECGIQPVMPVHDAITLLERHLFERRVEAEQWRQRAESAELGCEIAYQREPTQAEGDAHEHPKGSGECYVAMGGWTGRRCRACGRWVWGGPTACEGCEAQGRAGLRERFPEPPR